MELLNNLKRNKMTQGEMFSDLALEQQYDNMIKALGMKQETLEEAADKYSMELLEAKTIQPHEKSWVESIFAQGAKWHPKTRYSYDEVRQIAYNAYCLAQLEEPTENKFNGWIQQFKK